MSIFKLVFLVAYNFKLLTKIKNSTKKKRTLLRFDFFFFRLLNQNICRIIFANFYSTSSTTIETKFSILILIIFFMLFWETRDFRFFDDVLSNSHFLKCSMNLCWIFVFFLNFAKGKTKILINFEIFFSYTFYKSLSNFSFDDTVKNQTFHCIVFLFIVCRRMWCCFDEKNTSFSFFVKFELSSMLFEFNFFFTFFEIRVQKRFRRWLIKMSFNWSNDLSVTRTALQNHEIAKVTN